MAKLYKDYAKILFFHRLKHIFFNQIFNLILIRKILQNVDAFLFPRRDLQVLYAF
jgi:hypothetical protein